MKCFQSLKLIKCLCLLTMLLSLALNADYDLTVVGTINQADGIGRQAAGLIDCLKSDLKINFVETRVSFFKDVKDSVKKIALTSCEKPAPVSILEDILWVPNFPAYEKVPNSPIKIAYSLWESTFIPQKWVNILNEHFDAVAVADSFLVEVYKDSGVTIPIFEVPLGIYIEDYLKTPPKKSRNKTFVFGSTVSFEKRKNQATLIKAFAKEFGNNKNVLLKLNGRYGEIESLKKLVKSLNVKNVIISSLVLSNKLYDSFIRSFDCFVNISKGEGFSICPREALALGIPCIVTNNTAQKSICDTGFVCSVPAEIAEWPDYERSGLPFEENSRYYGCTVEDVQAALRDVYDNYEIHLMKARQGREWVRQYLWKNLKATYINLIKPKKIILGDRNIVTDSYLMTNSPELYKKYCELYQNDDKPSVPYR